MRNRSYFSAADLVKRSAAQLLYFINKNIQVEATFNQIKGDYHAAEIVLKEEASAEKRGVVNYKDITVFFCIDMVKDNKYVEIKMVHDMNDYPKWYLESSIMQATFYASLLQDVKRLDTPTFRQKEGYMQELVVVENPEYELWFGEDKYRIFPDKKVKKHYLKKAMLIYNHLSPSKDIYADYGPCKNFDAKYKFQEFEIFKPKFEKI